MAARQRTLSVCSLLSGLLLLSHAAAGLRFIAAPLLAISPAMDVMGTAAQLHSRGHEVLVVVTGSALPFVKDAAARQTSNTTAEGLRYAVVDITWRKQQAPTARAPGAAPPPSHYTIPPSAVASALFRVTAGHAMVADFQPGVALMAQQLLSNASLMQELREFKADAVMSVGLSIGGPVIDSTGCLLAHALGVPAIDVSGNAFFDGPVTTPQFGTGLTPAELSTQPAAAALNAAAWAFNKLAAFWDYAVRTPPSTSLREAQGLPQPCSSCPAANAARQLRSLVTRGALRRCESCAPLLELRMTSWLVEYPRSLAANQLLVGAGTPRPAHAVPEPDVAAFVDGATDAGLVLVAFGTVYGPTLRPEDMTQLAAGFAALAPTRVLWALKPAALPPGVALSELPLGPNTKVVPWVDYNDVLGHPATRAVVSHCGLHSVNEAAFHGVPIVAVPFQFEQAEHASKLVSRGAGVLSTEAPAYRTGAKAGVTYTADHIAGLVREVLGNASYSRAAAGIASGLQTYTARRHPYERAADEIELALATVAAAQSSRGAAAAVSGGGGGAQQHVSEEL